MALDTGIRPHQLTFGTLFKIIFAASVMFWLAFGVIIAVLAYFGFQTVTWNGEAVTGLPGLMGGLAISFLIGLIFGGFGSVVLALVVKLFGALLPLGTVQSTRAPNTTVSE